MKPYALATVLVKLLGLSLTISGMISLISLIWQAFYFMVFQGDHPSTHNFGGAIVGQLVAHAVPSLAVGLLLLMKSAYFVQNIFKINANE